MAINPVQATYAIEESYRNYLTTTFGFKDLDLQKQFIEQLQQPGKFLNGPILEATPSFKTGLTIEKLIDEGILSKEFRSLNAPSLPLDRTLYLHQEKAIRKVVSHKRNIVVATGTGSGKTETFLIPILDYLLKEQEVGRLSPGVRALLLYPMNALANDQMLRLRTLLKNYPYITFGRYTGETENEYSKALSQYRNMFHSDPIPNELISREQMRKKPPHILLTNYAMLEYLLLRPKDNVFFDGIYAKYWHFIVMDEVHTYSGAKGIEMAMLLRRLKERIVQSEPGRLQCIATSATLGRGREDFPQIVHFASQMFGEPFEWVETDPLRQDVIEGERIPMIQPTVSWGEPEVKTYQHWKKIIDSSEKANILDELIEVGKSNLVICQEINFNKNKRKT